MKESGEPPATRISDATQAMRIFDELWDADIRSAWNRARVQELIDGVPPYSRGLMRRQGNAFRTNLNFGEAGAIVEAALSSYYDLIESPEVLFRVKLPHSMPDWGDMEDVASEELQWLFRRRWNDFDTRWDVLSSEFVEHGVGFGYFPDDIDWKWDSGGWDDFLVPRDTRVSEDEVEVLIGIRKMPVHKLYAKIREEDAAKKMGWKVNAVKKEITAATKGESARANWNQRWAELEKQFKSNDFGESYGTSTTVCLVHFWVREFSGKISHYVCSRDWRKQPEFLYVKRDRFENPNQAYVIFTNGVGNGASLHSIRGLGHKIYASVMELNKVRCYTLDNAKLSGTVLFKRAEHAASDEPPLAINGVFGMLSQETEVVTTGIQDRSESLLRVSNELSMLTQNNSGQYRPNAINPNNSDKTKYEIQAQQELTSRLSTSQVNLFYRSLRKLGGESFRRIIAIGPNNSRFPEVKEFFQRCSDRGVPFEVLKRYTELVCERAIGNGSPAQRQVAFDRMEGLAGTFDEIGKNNFIRDKISHITGDRTRADRYLPKTDQPRPVIDEKIALMENNDMAQGKPVQRLVGENDAIHAGIHIDEILRNVQALEQIRNSGQAVDLNSTMPMLEFLDVAIPHTKEHVAPLESDPLRQSDYGAYKQAIQQSEAIFYTYLRQVQQIAREQQSEAANQEGGMSEEEKMKWLEFNQKMRRLWVEHGAKMQMKAEEVQQDMAIKRIEADQKLAEQARTSATKTSPKSKAA